MPIIFSLDIERAVALSKRDVTIRKNKVEIE